jgi:hypothetical protein
MPRKQRVSRAVYAVFVVLVAAFVASSIAQVASAVFATPVAGEAARGEIGDRCASALRDTIDAIDRARLVASAEANADISRARYATEREQPQKAAGNPAAACAGDPGGAEALAAVARLDRAAEAHAIREARDLSPVRALAQSFIRGPHR